MAERLIALILSCTRLIQGKQEVFIVGGNKAGNIKDFAYCAALYIDDGVRCGSSILTQDLLLTAAHCVKDVRKIMATVGSVDRNGGTKENVLKFIYHEQYSEYTIANDIGMCKMKKSLNLGQDIKKVVLLKKPPFDLEGVVAGWGAIEEKRFTDTQQLKYVPQKLWTHSQCKAILKDTLPKGTICGGEKLSKNFASAGDSGGALVVRECIQVGLVSFKDTTKSNSLVAYTDVSHFLDWVEATSLKLYCNKG